MIDLMIIEGLKNRAREIYPHKTEEQVTVLAYAVFDRVTNSNDRAKRILATMGCYI